MNFKSPWSAILCLLAFILAVFVVAQSFSLSARGLEGFQQMTRFSSKRGDENETYDEFYADIHDKIFQVAERTKYESDILYSNTQMDSNSSVLELGCGAGHLVADLERLGVGAILGADRSTAMVDKAMVNRAIPTKGKPTSSVKRLTEQEMVDPMAFEKAQFTHILALNREIYKHKDKIAFFRKCNYWLIPGGYLVVHLLNPLEFDATVPLAKTAAYKAKSHIAKDHNMSVINMIDMEYKNSYDYDAQTQTLKQTETMTDGASGKVRQNEHAFYMDNDVLQHAQYAGFSVIGEYAYVSDPSQRMVVLRKM